jgi:ferritin-like protein
MSSEALHEDAVVLGPDAIDFHRALVSVMEELEAVDWYNQRARAAGDGDLRAVLEHNRDEEKEHAAMALEWLRRKDPVFAAHLRTYLFTDRPITEIEKAVEGQSEAAPPSTATTDGSLGIGSLRRAEQ